jgi:hypothetical protein
MKLIRPCMYKKNKNTTNLLKKLLKLKKIVLNNRDHFLSTLFFLRKKSKQKIRTLPAFRA